MRLAVPFVILILSVSAQDVRYQPVNQEFPGPPNPAAFADWLADIKHWRDERKIRIGYDGSQYARPEFKWAQSSFIQPQMMVEDRYFYDPVARKYTVDRYLDDLEKRYGGIDSVLVWHTYPNIGLDDRNQNDLLRDMPGGMAGLRQMVADFHRRGVRVFYPIMLWDQGTHEYGMSNWEATAKLFAEAGADGLNGDTMRGVPRAFRDASDRAGNPLILEPENGLDSDEMLMWNNMSWGYWRYSSAPQGPGGTPGPANFPPVPTVSRFKWLEPRHMINICRRWARDKTDDLQHAFFNGIGYESWENIWGIWNQIPDRHAEALRRISKIERRFADLLIGPDWEPHTPVLQPFVYASKFPSGNATLWTFVNRNEFDVAGRQIQIPHMAGIRYYDLWNGVELKPEIQGDSAMLGFPMEAHGYGSVLASAAAAPGFDTFLAQMAALAKTSLQSLSAERRLLPQQVVPIAATAKASAAPAGMIKIPAASFDFRVSGIMVEGSNEIGVDVQYAWENSARRHHSHTMQIPAFYMDRYPATNAAFKKFLDASNYRPADDHNFLKDWKNGTFPAGWENKPVTWVSIEDARAYAQWAGKRLPHEWEWQYASQGTDGRLYPWGKQWDATAVPKPDTGRNLAPAGDVHAHPRGASPFGVEDLVGNIWQWTDEYVDDHTRAGILRGGSHYQPQGSHWYFPQTYKLTEHGKYLLMAPSKDRSGAVGFRCAVDAE